MDLSRRRFLQGTTALVSSVYGASLLAADAPQFAEKPGFTPQALFLTWQGDPTTTMTVQWIGSSEDGAARPVWFCRDGGLEWQSTPAKVKPYPSSDLKIYRTELTGLTPDTLYRFRVGLDSAERSFRTAPAKQTNAIQFVSGGDSGINREAQQINQVAANQSPMFVVMGGDLAYENGRDGATFLTFLKNYSQQVVDDKGRMIPLVACLGNHEVNGGYEQNRDKAPYFYSVFDGMFTDTGYGVLDFGDYMSVILLDSNHTTPIAGEQTSWLEKQLKAREHNPNLFVFYHVPSYPSYRTYDLNKAEVGTGHDSRKHWVPLFERYGVDAVFEHHDHTFKRTHLLLDGRPDANGIPYLGDGSWGKIRRPKTPTQIPYLAVSQESYHLSVHRIEGPERFHVALSERGRIMDVCTTTKRPRN